MATLSSYNSYAGYFSQLIIDKTPPDSAFIRQFYRLLMAYYKTNGVYTYINEELMATLQTDSTIKPLRNPAWRIVEFYAGKLFPGTLPSALPIKTENDAIIPAIEQLWAWSNFSSVKQKWARWFAIYGDWFIRISTKTKDDQPSSVYMSLIEPEYVNDFTLDERGFLTWIRVDIPIVDDEGESEFTYTEVWSKEEQTLSIWKNHSAGYDAKLNELPSADTIIPFEEIHGEDFIPIVYQGFRDDGAGRCGGSFSAQLDKIDEANRQATRLAQLLFRYNRALWVASRDGVDASGRPLPPASFDGIATDSTLTFMDDELLVLPTMSKLESLVPNINFSDALRVLDSQMQELAKDLPELAYFELREMGELSGRAVRFLLDDMITKVEEARGNAESALIRAHQMALTIGRNVGLFEASIGDFTLGDFNHEFGERAILPQDMTEIAQIVSVLSTAGVSIFAAAKAAGFSEDEAQNLAQVDLFGLEVDLGDGSRTINGQSPLNQPKIVPDQSQESRAV